MVALRILTALVIGSLFSLAGGAASASFMPVLDEFRIIKSGNEIFRDSFGDEVLPPSGPDGLSTYVTLGQPGMTSETGGRLTMTPSLGDKVLITTTLADVTTAGLRSLAVSPDDPNILDQANSFEIHGLFDMSILPAITGQSFGVRANDRAPGLGFDGNNTFYLFVGVSETTGDVGVFLRLNDFELDTSVVLWATSIQSVLPSADQIELILSKAAGSSQINASFSIFDSSDSKVLSEDKTAETWLLYQPETGPTGSEITEVFVRAQFISTDRVTVPEPATLSLFGLGLAGLGAARRRRTAA